MLKKVLWNTLNEANIRQRDWILQLGMLQLPGDPPQAVPIRLWSLTAKCVFIAQQAVNITWTEPTPCELRLVQTLYDEYFSLTHKSRTKVQNSILHRSLNEMRAASGEVEDEEA